MANTSNIFATLALILATFMTFSVQKIQSDDYPDFEYPSDDPLADASGVDYFVPPYFPPHPNDPDVAISPNDIDFPGFSSKNELDDFLINCQKNANIDLKCGVDYHVSVFQKDVRPVGNCCLKLVKQGKKCHDLITRFVLRYGGFSYDRETSLKRSERVWAHCSRVVEYHPQH